MQYCSNHWAQNNHPIHIGCYTETEKVRESICVLKMNDPISLTLDKCTFIPPSLHAWIYAVAVHATCCLIGGVPCGILLYFVLKKSSGGQKAKERTNAGSIDATRSFFGVVVGSAAAASIYFGRPIIESYSPNSPSTFIGPVLASTFGFTTFFKSLNAAFGTYPEGADSDLRTWLLWYVMLPEPTFAKGKLIKASRKEVTIKIREFCFKIIAVFLLLTVLMQYSPPYYQVLKEGFSSSSSQEGNDKDNGNGMFAWFLAVHVNGFFHLWLLYSYFSFCLDFSMITNYVVSGGVRMEPAFCNPLLESRAFKETWGTRWNRPVNALLKRTVYVPARRSGLCNKNMAAVLTFLASGLLHEYNFSIHNNRSLLSPSGYRPGEVTAFFIIMGILMVVESWVWNQLFPRWLQTVINRLPSAATASMLTFMVAGLAETYFLKAWFQSGFVEAVAQMLPHMNCQ